MSASIKSVSEKGMLNVLFFWYCVDYFVISEHDSKVIVSGVTITLTTAEKKVMNICQTLSTNGVASSIGSEAGGQFFVDVADTAFAREIVRKSGLTNDVRWIQISTIAETLD